MEEEVPYKQLLENRREPYKELFSTARFLCVLLAVLACFLIIFTQILIGVKVSGDSMQPTLQTGDYLFVCTLTEPKHGHIVVVPNPSDSGASGKYLIKRVIGLPGDTIMAENGVLYRRGPEDTEFHVVEEDFLGEPWIGDIPQETVKPGHIYVLGDNRNNSTDSRRLGQFSIDEMLGVVTQWSVEHKEFLTAVFGFLQP